MKRKLLVIMTMTLMLMAGNIFVVFAEDDPSDDATGTVMKIVGKTVTVKEANDKQKTIEVKDLKGLKVGDYVIIDDLKVKKINPERKKGLDLK